MGSVWCVTCGKPVPPDHKHLVINDLAERCNRHELLWSEADWLITEVHRLEVVNAALMRSLNECTRLLETVVACAKHEQPFKQNGVAWIRPQMTTAWLEAAREIVEKEVLTNVRP